MSRFGTTGGRSLFGKRLAFIGYDHPITRCLGDNISSFIRFNLPQVQYLTHLSANLSDLRLLSDWSPDAVVAHCSDSKVKALALSFDCPLVNTSGRIDPEDAYPTVTVDQVEVGRLAARYLRSRNCPSICLIGQMNSKLTKDQWAGLKEEWQSATGAISFWDSRDILNLPRVQPVPADIVDAFVDWYENLADASGVVAGESQLQALCNLAFLRKGSPIDHLALLGLHDYGTVTFPQLSAIRMPEERWGSLAAEKALRLIAEPDREEKSVYLAPDGIEERESTSTVTTGDRYMRRALEVIQERAGIRTTVAEVALEVGLVRRALEIRFRNHLNCTVLEEIHRVHVERAKSLLANSNLTIDEVAEKSGFTDHFHLRRIFKQRDLPPPGTYRKQVRRKRVGYQ